MTAISESTSGEFFCAKSPLGDLSIVTMTDDCDRV